MSFTFGALRITALCLSGVGLGALASAQSPSAEFSGAPRLGVAPHTVSFTNFSSGGATEHAWSFGDGETSDLVEPLHTFAAAGTYTVSLSCSGSGGSDTETKLGYITVLEPPPLSDFVGTPLTGAAPTTVSFSDTSVGAVTGWAWNFGDRATSNLANPSHTYSTPGTYSVSLSTSGPGGVHSITKADYVVIDVPAPVAEFSAAPTGGLAPLSVQFTGLSTGDVTSHVWAFGDGSASTQQSPNHVYSNPGIYTVTLDISGAHGTDGITKTDYITVLTPAPVAAFTGTPLTGVSPLTVAFTDTSTGSVTSWAWNFGDGGTSSMQSPGHTYVAPGTYTLILIATGPGGSDSQVESNYVVVGVPAPVVDFTGTPLTGVAPLAVNFTDQSTGSVTGHSWSFGDTMNSTAQSPGHVYSDPGTYTVSLMVNGPGGLDDITKTNHVTVLEPPPSASFTGTPTAGVAPHTVSFQDFSSGNALTYSWDFGDGESSTQASPTHTYLSSGTYSI
ncbi:MAG: cell surface protein, partial [Planctomycetes bacterium]|nr:cell surface protein [Planctomycetota bacterium]